MEFFTSMQVDDLKEQIRRLNKVVAQLATEIELRDEVIAHLGQGFFPRPSIEWFVEKTLYPEHFPKVSPTPASPSSRLPFDERGNPWPGE